MKTEYIIATLLFAVGLTIGVIYVFSPEMMTSSSTSLFDGVEKKELSMEEKKTVLSLAPEISTPDGYVNTENKAITLAQLKGDKVVLLDIWTYSCINCQRTIPYLNTWYEKYKDQGLEIIGLHTPEFAFEKKQKNVEDAVRGFDIKYPVVLDNDFSTWNAYGNQYWPRKYLIDIDGYVSYDHIGEGGYAETEQAIVRALNERNKRLGIEKTVTVDGTFPTVAKVESGKVKSSEVYFGSWRNELLANGNVRVPGSQTLTIPKNIQANKLYLGGVWNITTEYAETKDRGNLMFKYNAKNVYMVASGDMPVEVEVLVDGVVTKKITVQGEQLYVLVEGASYDEHVLELRVKNGSLKAFTFTFG
ncbi:MAG: redoxin domain-containing protein [Candidatus Zambryskibacteria bacterium]|nr:redoxin domain-containing protein [Candidatus Zambryskibacteria bacterium]